MAPDASAVGRGIILKVSSSNVRPKVSGKNKYTKPTSNASQQQYEIRYFQPTSPTPIGFTKVVKKLARRPKSWKNTRPRERSMYGHTSIM